MSSDSRRSLPLPSFSGRWSRDVAVDADPAVRHEDPEVGHATSDERKDLLRPSNLLLLLMTAGLAAALMWALQGALIDDAFITLDYARTLAFHGDWGALPGIPSNTATSPLNVIVVAAVTIVVRDPIVALWIVTIANAVLLAVGLIRLGNRWQVGSTLAWIATPLLLLNPILASSIGLETVLVVTTLVWLLAAGAAGNSRAFGWFSGIGIALRPDFVLIAGVVWLMHPALRRPRALRATFGTAWRASVVGLPWYIFSWFYFGSAIPDTLVIKQSQVWGDFVRGLWDRYHSLYPEATLAVVIGAALGIVALLATPLLALGRYRPVALSVCSAGLAGLVYYATYAQLGVPPYFWYYGIPSAALTLVLAFAIAALAATAAGRNVAVSRALAGLLAVAVLTPALIAWNQSLSKRAPLDEALIHGNWALTPQYKQIGLDLAERLPPGAIVRSAGEFGTILYYCKCTLIDRFDQRGLVMNELEDARDSSWIMKLNYRWLDPDAYPLMKQEYHLNYRRGATTKPLDWNVWSPTKRNGFFGLRDGPRPQDVRDGLQG